MTAIDSRHLCCPSPTPDKSLWVLGLVIGRSAAGRTKIRVLGGNANGLVVWLEDRDVLSSALISGKLVLLELAADAKSVVETTSRVAVAELVNGDAVTQSPGMATAITGPLLRAANQRAPDSRRGDPDMGYAVGGGGGGGYQVWCTSTETGTIYGPWRSTVEEVSDDAQLCTQLVGGAKAAGFRFGFKKKA